MGVAVELLTGRVVAPGGTLSPLIMSAGNSLTVRNAADGTKVELIQAWGDNQVTGSLRVRSPLMHDNVQGIKFAVVANEVDPLFPAGFAQTIAPQDTLVIEQSGSGVASDIESSGFLVYYEDLPGIDGRFIDRAGLADRMVHLLTVENTLVLGTGGGYSGEEAINAETSLLKANIDYALLGYHVSDECAAVRWRGADFGNLGVGGPGNPNSKQITGSWFVSLSDNIGVPLIPVFNSANASAVLIDGVQDENGVDVVVTSILAQLSSQ